MDRADVFYTCTDSYAPFTGVSVLSLFMHNKDIKELNVYLVADGLSDDNREKFMQLSRDYGREVIFVDGSRIIEKIKRLGLPSYRGVYVTLFKLFIGEFVRPDVERLLYIDCDTLVTGSIAPLFSCDMGDNVIGLAHDSIVLWDYKGHPYVERNIGAALFNVRKWINEQWEDRIVDSMIKREVSYPVLEQSAVNHVCTGHIMELPLAYNFQVPHRVFSDKAFFRTAPKPFFYTPEDVKEARNDPVILHIHRFLGELPWQTNVMHPDKELFDKYLQMSPWRGYEKKPAPQGLMFRIERLLYRVLPRGAFLYVFNTYMLVTYKRNYRKQKVGG